MRFLWDREIKRDIKRVDRQRERKKEGEIPDIKRVDRQRERKKEGERRGEKNRGENMVNTIRTREKIES